MSLSKEQIKTMEQQYIKVIKDQLVILYANDNYFMEAYNKLNDKKYNNEMLDYVKGLAKNQAYNGCAMVDDKTVYSWAREFYLDYETRKENNKKELEKEKYTKVKLLIHDIKQLDRYYELAHVRNVEVVDLENKLSAKIGSVDELEEKAKEIKAKIEQVLKAESDSKKVEVKKEEPKKEIKKEEKPKPKPMSIFDFM